MSIKKGKKFMKYEMGKFRFNTYLKNINENCQEDEKILNRHV